MKKIYNSKFDREIMHIHPGEFYISAVDAIYTILGSCVSVVLYSARKKIGGLNHFMLPSTSATFTEKDYEGRYGVHAMELLINGLMKEGVSKRELSAKVFGGGNVLNADPTSRYLIGFKNTDFVFKFLADENIPVIARDVGADYGRKIYFFPETGKVLVSRIVKRTTLVYRDEEKYMDILEKKTKKKDTKIILFDD